MRKGLIIVLLLALFAALGWFLVYCFSTHHHRAFRSNAQIMEWLKHEYNLTPTQYAAISKLQEEFRPVMKQQIKELRDKKALLKKLEDEHNSKPEIVAQAIEDLRVSKEITHGLLKNHVEKAAALMSPEQSVRYLKKMAEHHLY